MNFRYAISLILFVVLFVIISSLVIAQSNNAPNILSMEWSADGSRFAMTTGAGLSIYDQSLNLVAYQAFPTDFNFVKPHIALNPDGTRIYMGNDTEKRILDTTTLQPVVDFQDADIGFHSPQWNSDGSEIAFRRGDGRATVIYDATNGDLLRSFSSLLWGAGYYNLRGFPIWSPDDSYFAGVIGGDTIVIFDATSGQEIVQYQVAGERISEIAWSPDEANPRLALSTRVVQIAFPIPEVVKTIYGIL